MKPNVNKDEYEIHYLNPWERHLVNTSVWILTLFRVPLCFMDTVKRLHIRGKGQGKFLAKWSQVRIFGNTWMRLAHFRADDEANYFCLYVVTITRKIIGFVWQVIFWYHTQDRFMWVSVFVKFVTLAWTCKECWSHVETKREFRRMCIAAYEQAGPRSKKVAGGMIASHFGGGGARGAHAWHLGKDIRPPIGTPGREWTVWAWWVCFMLVVVLPGLISCWYEAPVSSLAPSKTTLDSVELIQNIALSPEAYGVHQDDLKRLGELLLRAASGATGAALNAQFLLT